MKYLLTLLTACEASIISASWKSIAWLIWHLLEEVLISFRTQTFHHILIINFVLLVGSHLTPKLDVFLSHDWPSDIWNFGNRDRLLKQKPYFKADMASGKLGSPPLMELLRMLKPRRWFAAHLHVRFDAVVPHDYSKKQSASPIRGTQHNSTSNSTNSLEGQKKMSSTDADEGDFVPFNSSEYTETRFMALDKVLPGRDFLQIVSIPVLGQAGPDDESDLKWDVEWVSVLRKTHFLLQTSASPTPLPSVVETVTDQVVGLHFNIVIIINITI